MNLEIFIPGEPPRATAQQKGYNRYTGRYYKKKSVLDAAEKYDFYIQQAVREHKALDRPLDVPVAALVEFVFPTTVKKLKGKPKTTRPDLDNMAKQLIDELTACQVVKDDALIYQLTIKKRWCGEIEPPHVYVSLTWSE